MLPVSIIALFVGAWLWCRLIDLAEGMRQPGPPLSVVLKFIVVLICMVIFVVAMLPIEPLHSRWL